MEQDGEEPAAACCAVCSRSIAGALACVDVATGETLCPVHYRKRHFQKVFDSKKLEKWTPTPRRQSVAALVDKYQSSSSPPAAAERQGSGSTTTPKYSLAPVALQWDTPGGGGGGGGAGSSSITSASGGGGGGGATGWERRWMSWRENEHDEQRLHARADEWRPSAEQRRFFRAVRARLQTPAELAARAFRFRVGRCLAAFVAATQSQAYRRGEHRRHQRSAARLRGFRAFRTHAVVASRIASADRWSAARALGAALTILRWNALVTSSRSLLSLRHAGSRRLAQWQMRTLEMIQAQADLSTAILHHRCRALPACLARWSTLTRVTTVTHLESEIAMKLHRRHSLRGGCRALAAAAAARHARMAAREAAEEAALQEAEGKEVEAAEEEEALARLHIVEARVMTTEEKLAVVTAQARRLEQLLTETRRLLIKERKDATAAQAAFRRERETLLRQLGAANERLAEQQQQEQQQQQHGHLYGHNVPADENGVVTPVKRPFMQTPSRSITVMEVPSSTPASLAVRTTPGSSTAKPRRAFRVVA